MFHRFAELGAAPVLVRSTDLIFQQDIAPAWIMQPAGSFRFAQMREGARQVRDMISLQSRLS
jgi:hypothetical protein